MKRRVAVLMLGIAWGSVAMSASLFKSKVSSYDFLQNESIGPFEHSDTKYAESINTSFERQAKARGITLLPYSDLKSASHFERGILGVSEYIRFLEAGRTEWPWYWKDFKRDGQQGTYLAISIISVGVFPLMGDFVSTLLLRRYFKKVRAETESLESFSYQGLWDSYISLQLDYECKSRLPIEDGSVTQYLIQRSAQPADQTLHRLNLVRYHLDQVHAYFHDWEWFLAQSPAEWERFETMFRKLLELRKSSATKFAILWLEKEGKLLSSDWDHANAKLLRMADLYWENKVPLP